MKRKCLGIYVLRKEAKNFIHKIIIKEKLSLIEHTCGECSVKDNFFDSVLHFTDRWGRRLDFKKLGY